MNTELEKVKNIVNSYLIEPSSIVGSLKEKLEFLYGIEFEKVSKYKVSLLNQFDSDDVIYIVYVIFDNGKKSIEIGKVQLFEEEVNKIKSTEDSIHLIVNKLFIKRHLYNTFTSDISDKKSKTFNSNIKYIFNLPEQIISQKQKENLINRNYQFKIGDFKLTSRLKFIIKNKGTKFLISYSLKLEEIYNGRLQYVGLSTDAVFRRVLNEYLSEKYTLKEFGKKIDKLTEKEKKILDMYIY